MRRFTLIAIAMLATVSTAHAGNTKFFPGAMCQGSVAESGFSRIFVGTTPITVPFFYFRPASQASTGAAHNPSQQAEMQLICPIVRDEVRGDGLGWTSLVVNVLNTSNTRNLVCKAETFFKNDFRFGSITAGAVGPNTDWTDVSFAAQPAPTDGYMLVSCVLPRVDDGDFPSGIASYRIDE